MSLRILWGRQSLATLGIVTMLALVGQVLAISGLMLIAGLIIPPLLILAIISLVLAALVATGLRWMPLVGALYCVGTMIGGLVSQQYLPYHLSHPGEVGFFIAALLIYIFSIIALYAGIGATIQNYRSVDRKAPRWFASTLVGLAGFVLGAFLVAMIVARTPQATAGAVTLNGMPAVHLGVSSFIQSSVTVPKGSKLVLIDDGQFPHILRNGRWVSNTPLPAAEPGAPTVSNLNVNGNTVEIGPFNTVGTFHIFCTIHPGMNLTIVVQ